MLPDLQAMGAYFKFVGAMGLLSGAMAWFTRKGTPEEDKEVAAAHEAVIDTLLDGDMVNRIDLRTGRNLRDQISIGELEELNRERELRQFPRRN